MKILMVCLGNICRSPLAEGVLSHKLAEKHLKIQVDSAGTGSWHAGERPDGRAILVAKKYGVDISNQRARQVTLSDFDTFDKIYVADREVFDHMTQMAREHKKDVSKIDFLMNALEPGSDRPVPDPYFGGDEGFENVFNMIDEVCDVIVKNIAEGKKV